MHCDTENRNGLVLSSHVTQTMADLRERKRRAGLARSVVPSRIATGYDYLDFVDDLRISRITP